MRTTCTRKSFALRLLQYHDGQWSAVYALGSTLLAGYAVSDTLIRNARDEMRNEAARPHRPGYGSKWMARALMLWVYALNNWLLLGLRPWQRGN